MNRLTSINIQLQHKFLPSLIFLSVVVSCGETGGGEQQVDREAIKEEMEQREIKRILPAELVEGAYQRGNALAEKARRLVLQTYPQPKEGEQQTQGFMTTAARTKIDSLAQVEDVSIAWVSEASDTSGLGNKERQLWEAYLYNVENDLPLNDNVQRIGEEEYLYTKPLIIDSAIRRQTQGSEGDSTAFLGMWSIRVSKKNLIQSMNAP